MYAHMCSRSTTPVSSCSAPIGSWIATQRSESCARAASSARKKSARSRSSMFTKTTRESSYSSARAQTRDVFTSTPMTPLRTTSAPSTTRSAANVSAWKPASPGQSIRLILRSCQSRWQQRARERHLRASARRRPSRRRSCPASTVPSRLIFPAWKSMRLGERGLPDPAVADDGDVADLPGLGRRHQALILLATLAVRQS